MVNSYSTYICEFIEIDVDSFTKMTKILTKMYSIHLREGMIESRDQFGHILSISH